MKGQAPAYWVDARTLVTGLFDEDSEESTLLQLAACNQIELHATSGTWNTLLWMLTTAPGSQWCSTEAATRRRTTTVRRLFG